MKIGWPANGWEQERVGVYHNVEAEGCLYEVAIEDDSLRIDGDMCGVIYTAAQMDTLVFLWHNRNHLDDVELV